MSQHGDGGSEGAEVATALLDAVDALEPAAYSRTDIPDVLRGLTTDDPVATAHISTGEDEINLNALSIGLDYDAVEYETLSFPGLVHRHEDADTVCFSNGVCVCVNAADERTAAAQLQQITDRLQSVGVVEDSTDPETATVDDLVEGVSAEDSSALEDLAERARRELDVMVDRGIVDGVDDDVFDEILSVRTDLQEASAPVDRETVQWFVRKYLASVDRAFSGDLDRIEGYRESYGELIETFRRLAGGAFEDVEYRIEGDQQARENADLVVDTGDRQVVAVLEFEGTLADYETFVDCMNRVAEATGVDRRFVPVGEGLDVVFADPDRAGWLQECFGFEPSAEFQDPEQLDSRL